jgi:hypothetical protein
MRVFGLHRKTLHNFFGVAVPAISKHFKNIFESGELNKNSVISKMETTFSILETVRLEEERFLESNSLEDLPNAVVISHELAIEKAYTEFEEFRIEQDKKYISDLDKEIKKITKK